MQFYVFSNIRIHTSVHVRTAVQLSCFGVRLKAAFDSALCHKYIVCVIIKSANEKDLVHALIDRE